MKDLKKIRGVNIGGWLVLERWMTPSLFGGLNAKDETDFVNELGDQAGERLKQHRDQFITEKDFEWLHSVGVNTIRIPVGHWIFGDCPPYVGAIEYLDWAMDMAYEYEIGVLIDFHAAPGCQNGFDNGGISGVMEWHKHKENIESSIHFIERLANRYADSPALWGIQLLNEPHWKVPMDILQDYYCRAYDVARQYLNEKTTIVMHDGFRLNEWEDFFKNHEFKNVILDTHMYQCFREEDSSKRINDHLNETLIDRSHAITEVSQYVDVCVGEWSLGLRPECLKDESVYNQSTLIPTLYGLSQILANEKGIGWFFWSYKLEENVMPHWSFRESVTRGWLPNQF